MTSFQARVGECLILPKPGGRTPHLWVIVARDDNVGDVDDIAIVNLTTKRSFSDLTTVLNIGDHPFIHHESVIYYADARISTSAMLTQAVNSSLAEAHRGFQPAVLQRIQSGVLKSEFTPNKIKRFCGRCWGQ